MNEERLALEVLKRVRAMRADPHAEEVAQEISRRAGELTLEGSPKRFTYNKIWWLLTIADIDP